MDVRELSVINLAHQCQEETARYLRRESGEGVCCFELFRRAVADRDDQAWERVVIQYRRMVLAWVRRHPTRALVNESDDDWVHDAFARFWKAVPPDRFAMFPNLAAILRYLKLCVHSSLMDEARASEAQRASVLTRVLVIATLTLTPASSSVKRHSSTLSPDCDMAMTMAPGASGTNLA